MEEVNAGRRLLRKMQRQQAQSREAYTATALPLTRTFDSIGKMILSDIDSHTRCGRQLARGKQIRDRLCAFRCSNGAAYPALSSLGTARPSDGGPSLTTSSRYMILPRLVQFLYGHFTVWWPARGPLGQALTPCRESFRSPTEGLARPPGSLAAAVGSLFVVVLNGDEGYYIYVYVYIIPSALFFASALH